MPDDPAPFGDPTPPGDPAPRRLSAQDQELLDDVTEMERVLKAARDDPEAQAVLAPPGFDPADLGARLALVTAAQQRIDDRAEAMAAEDRAGQAKKALFARTRADYRTFRKVVRPLFRRAPDALTALNLDSEVPDALDVFVTHARTAYANGAAAPYAARLAVRQYDAARLTALLGDLDALLTSVVTLTGAEARGVEATGKREEAAREARYAYAEFRDTARPLLDPHPELRRRIGL